MLPLIGLSQQAVISPFSTWKSREKGMTVRVRNESDETEFVDSF